MSSLLMPRGLSAFGIFFLAGTAGADELIDIKPPVAYPLNTAIIVLTAAAGLVGLLAAAAVVFRLLRSAAQGAPPPSPPVPPWETAYQRLDALRTARLPGQGKVQEYFTMLSNIVRRYVEDRFHIRAPEMTTPEFLFSLRNDPHLKVAQKEVLRGFLDCCDRVKFAKYPSDAHEMEDVYFTARRFVDETAGENSGRQAG